MKRTPFVSRASAAVRFDALPDLLTPDDVASVLAIRCRRPASLVRTLERHGLPVRRVNRRLRVLKSDLIRHLGAASVLGEGGQPCR